MKEMHRIFLNRIMPCIYYVANCLLNANIRWKFLPHIIKTAFRSQIKNRVSLNEVSLTLFSKITRIGLNGYVVYLAGSFNRVKENAAK